MSSAYLAAIEYLYSHINYERTGDSKPYAFRLRRMNELLDRLELRGISGRDIPVVHIAGTKGKGSTAAATAAMLTACGLRTGLYTSPHLVELEERFVVDGVLPTKDEVVDLAAAVREVADELDAGSAGPATFFELTTAMALLHFRRCRCEAVVLEVGLGGRLDSTNVCLPAVTAVTSIGMDHQHLLGNTLAEIAEQKAGIIKPAVPVVSGVRQPEAAAAIERIAGERSAPLYRLGVDFQPQISDAVDSRWGELFSLEVHRDELQARSDWFVPLVGRHQVENAAIACAMLDLLARSGLSLPLEAQRRGLAAVRCMGRIERFVTPEGVEVLLDAAHNVDSVDALCRCLQQRAAGRSIIVIFGTSCDKEHRPMLRRLAERADRIILTRYHGNPRYREPQEMAEALPSGTAAQIESDPGRALDSAIAAAAERSKSEPRPPLVVICGSFFLAAELRPRLIGSK